MYNVEKGVKKMKTEQIHVRVDEKTKEEFAKICYENGIDMSKGIVFLMQNFIKEKAEVWFMR